MTSYWEGGGDFDFDYDVDIFYRSFVVVLVDWVDGGAASVGLFIMVGMIIIGGDIVLLCYCLEDVVYVDGDGEGD